MHPSRSAGRRRFDTASRIHEIVGEAEHAGDFVAGLRIEIGVAAAGVDRAVTDTYVGETGRVIGPDRDVAGDVCHVVVNAGVPLQCERWVQIAECGERAIDAVEARERRCAARCRQCSCERSRERRGVGAVDSHQAGRGLRAQHRGRKGVGRDTKTKIQIGMDVDVHIGRHIRGDAADLELAGARHVGTGGNRVMPINGGP